MPSLRTILLLHFIQIGRFSLSVLIAAERAFSFFAEEEEIAEDTFILFTSDNGPETTWKKRKELFQHASNGPYREGKRSIYEGGHRVPFIVRWPDGIVSPGRISSSPVCQ